MSTLLHRFVVAAVVPLAIGCSGGDDPAPAALSPQEEAFTESASRPVRLYVFDCGHLRIADPGRFSLMPDEVSTLELSVPCYLIEHPDGRLVWDAGLSDDLAEGSPHTQENGSVTTVTTTLTAQLEELNLTPADVSYLALSHMHYDHAGNANMFAGSTWLVQRPEHEAAFGDAQGFFDRRLYADLEEADTIMLDGDHDVFGDGTVVIKAAPGHTPGHQVLFVDLVETGPVVLSGDLYHFPENRLLKRVPTFNFDEARTIESMDLIEDFLMSSGARLWIEHDIAANQRLQKSPAYYE
ncbi:MAG: N-acyl homoserine lactonase family protein [Vicinamibacterales bacterium]|nr:N-acyl homoserine lactonase family protein [Vicinamibacterales bacterium]